MADEKSTQPLSATDPMAAAAGAAAAFDAAAADFPDPVPERPDLVNLPAGLKIGDKIVKTAFVRELNGLAEEQIFRAVLSRNPYHIRATIIGCGARQIGDEPEAETPRLLKQMLIGDLDAIMLGIYRMTYGGEVKVPGWTCPVCGDTEDIGLDVDEDIEVRKLADPSDRFFRVPLRKGGEAMVRLPDAEDQAAAGDDAERTMPERNSIILQRCISEVTDAAGNSKLFVAFPNAARDMGIKDREAVLQAIYERSPGPQYTAIKFTHNSCGKEVT